MPNRFENTFGVNRLFSKEERRRLDPSPDVFEFERISEPIRQRILYHLTDWYGGSFDRLTRPTVQHLRREYGMSELPHTRLRDGFGNDVGDSSHETEYVRFFLFKASTQQALDVIQLAGMFAETSGLSYGNMANVPQFLAELNELLIEEKIGYQYQSGGILRLDNTFLHADVVVPAIELLKDPVFVAASAEFLKSHDLYLHGDFKNSILEACKSLESVLKVICNRNKWPVEPTATMSKLLSVVHEHGLFPGHLESGFTGLKSVLQSLVPTIRNRDAGHGDGAELKVVPAHMVAFVLHVTAASIVYFVQCDPNNQ